MECQLTINNPCVEARLRPDKHPRLKSYSKDNAVNLITEIIIKAYFYKGFKFDQYNVIALSETLYDEMMMDSHHMGMPQISMFEIGYAIKKAVMDNEDFFFSVSYLYNVIKKYCLKEGHEALEEAKKIIKREQQKQLPSPAQTMIENYSSKMITKSKNL